MKKRQPSFTKTGPGRRHIENKPGGKKRNEKGYRGASFSIPRPLSQFHPTVIARIRAAQEAAGR